MNQFFMYDSMVKKFQQEAQRTYCVQKNISVQTRHDCYALPPFPSRIDGIRVRLGGIVDNQGSYVPASSRFRNADHTLANDAMMGKYDFTKEKCLKLQGEYIYCGEWLDHWGHFLLESTTRLWYVVKNRKNNQKLLFLTREKNLKIKGNYKIFFQLLGISEKEILILTQPTHIETLIIPDATSVLGTYYTPEFKVVFDAVKNAVSPVSMGQKIYLSRCQCRVRQIMGEDKLERLFKQNGFQIVYPEKLPLDQLVLLLKNAEYVAGVSGSGMHNALFCGEKTKLIILNRTEGFNACQGLINEMNGLKCLYVDAFFNFFPTTDDPFWLGLTKPVKKMCEALKFNTCGIEGPTQNEVGQFFKKWYKTMFKQSHAITLENFEAIAEVAYDLFSEVSGISAFHKKKDLLKYTILSKISWGKYRQKYLTKLKHYQQKYGVQ